jgi:hypothetical protein
MMVSGKYLIAICGYSSMQLLEDLKALQLKVGSKKIQIIS